MSATIPCAELLSSSANAILIDQYSISLFSARRGASSNAVAVTRVLEFRWAGGLVAAFDWATVYCTLYIHFTLESTASSYGAEKV